MSGIFNEDNLWHAILLTNLFTYKFLNIYLQPCCLGFINRSDNPSFYFVEALSEGKRGKEVVRSLLLPYHVYAECQYTVD